MKDSLAQKMEAIQDEHFGEIEKQRLEGFDEAFKEESIEFRGGLRAVTSITMSLSSKLIEGLMRVEEKKYYLAWGFKTFAEFLNSDEVTDISKNKYYDLKKLLLSEGSEAFDVFTGKKIPVAARKLLASKGVEITVEGSELIIADQRVPIADKEAMKNLVEAVHDALKERDNREEKKDAKIEKQQATIEAGSSEIESLQRQIDALTETSPFAKALMAFFGAAQELIPHIKSLSKSERSTRADDDLRLITQQWFQIRDAYGLKVGLGDDMVSLRDRVAAMKPVEEMTAEERAETFMDRALATIEAEQGFDDLDEEGLEQ